MIRIKTLGPVSVTLGAGDETVAALDGHSKRLGLLVYLAVESVSRPIPRDRIETLFWPTVDHERARASLRQSLFVLRRNLGSETLFRGSGRQLQIHDDVVWCDAVAFQHLVDQGRLSEAMAVYDGPFVSTLDLHTVGDGFERWVEVRRASLERSMLAAASRLSQAAEAGENAELAIEWARRAVALAPGDETPVWRLVSLLYRHGQAPEALRVCEDFFARAWSQYGRPPSPQLRGLARALENGNVDRTFPEIPRNGDARKTRPRAGSKRRGERALLRAQGLFVLGQYRDAARVLSSMLEYPALNPLLYAEACLRLSEVYDQLGRRQESKERLGEFLGVLEAQGEGHAGLAREIRRRLASME